MNAEAIKELFGQLKLSHGVVKKLIEKFPDDKLDWKPANETRTVKEIITHFYGSGNGFVHAIQTGSLTEEENRNFEKTDAANVNELLKFCDAAFNSVYNLAITLTDDELVKKIKMFYGEFPTSQLLQFFFTEFYHHYGQLTVYARLLDIIPPLAYDFE
ncbi:MAG: DinB family protein [Bacteroidetes bacterium]|nr:DinB family protein [Bacteroidota bacterium]MBU2586119.1 DinB family protein [Bacteroidota bacterium]